MFRDDAWRNQDISASGFSGPRRANAAPGIPRVDIRSMGKKFRLISSVALSCPIAEVFAFFADAGNLDAITPPWLQFRILTPMPATMREGLKLDYRLRLRRIPIHWQSEITVWEPPYLFVDEQRKGPYRNWIHRHRFAAIDGGTKVFDAVFYAVPGGTLLHDRVVAPDLRAIFQFRREKLLDLFGPTECREIDT
jgi:ligand-binding SRPBCC domain-containing protein